jgi:transcriptional regulator with XRE-family HTH domain
VATPQIQAILQRLREAREQAGKTPEEIEDELILGEGWVERFESGASVPQIDLLIALARAVGTDLSSLVDGITVTDAASVSRLVRAEDNGAGGITVHFPYGEHDARYELEGATLDQFEEVLQVLRDSLTAGRKTEAVTDAFLKAVELWPDANPSDLWWFIVPRAYGDVFNHPATNARLDFGQSWKRTGGWALERVAVRHYASALRECGVRMWIPTKAEKAALLPDWVNPDKVDVLLTGTRESEANFLGEEVFFGIVNVKASFAERRTDDVPLSERLIGEGYTSIFWTMDCKSTPGTHPVNRGELGAVLVGDGSDGRSEKRRDFEVNGSFSACFSYNRRTLPTPEHQDVAARIYQLDFSDPHDAFRDFVCAAWEEFRRRTEA